MSIASTKPGTEAYREQEEIISRELLADGEFRGDDRRWQLAHRTLLEWTQAKDDELGSKLTKEQEG